MAKVLVPDQFPKGLRILVVDDDVVCLKVLAQMLEKCSYQVTCRVQATAALDLLRSKKGCFDLVLCDVYMPDMDGFKLLELIGLEMDLPVIMISGDGSTSTVLKGIRHGACDFLVKPVREEELKNLWQHVVRRMRNGNKEHENSGSVGDNNDDNNIRHKRGCDDSGCASSVSEGSDGVTKSRAKKKKDADEDDEDGDDNDLENEDPTALKKPRVVWSVELHQQFVNAVNLLGIDKAVPKRILELMNVPGLSRENVASHLQKFRLYLKRLSGVEQQHQTMIPSSLRGPVNQTRRLCSLQRFGIPSLPETSQIPSETLSKLQEDLLGQPIDRLPLLQATLQGPPKCTTSNGTRSGFAWTPNMLPPQQQQIHKQSTVLDPGPSINVQPSCVVIPSQLGSNPGLIGHNQGFNARSVENYTLAKSQLKSVVNGYFGFGTDSPSASSCSVIANIVPQVGNAVPLQMPAQHSVINNFPLSGNGTAMKSIPSRFAVDDIEFPIYDNITEFKHEPNVGLIDSSIPGTSIFHHFPNDFTSVFSEQARIGPK